MEDRSRYKRNLTLSLILLSFAIALNILFILNANDEKLLQLGQEVCINKSQTIEIYTTTPIIDSNKLLNRRVELMDSSSSIYAILIVRKINGQNLICEVKEQKTLEKCCTSCTLSSKFYLYEFLVDNINVLGS